MVVFVSFEFNLAKEIYIISKFLARQSGYKEIRLIDVNMYHNSLK